jgi:hypothetical protein
MFRRRSEKTSAGRQEMHRELSQTGTYKTKRSGHVIQRQPGGSVRGSYTKEKQLSDARTIPVIDAVAKQAQCFKHLTELVHGQGIQSFRASQMEVLMRRVKARVQQSDQDARANAIDESSPHVVYKWNFTNATNSKIRKAEAFARMLMPHIVAASDGAHSFNEIAKRLNEKGIKTKEGRDWSSWTISIAIERGRLIGMEEAHRLFTKFFVTNPGQSIYSPKLQRKQGQSNRED